MQAPPEYCQKVDETAPNCSKNDFPPVYEMDVSQLIGVTTWQRQFPPSYSEDGASCSTDCTTSTNYSIYDDVPTSLGRRLVYETRSYCWCFIATFLLMLLVLPLMCFLLYIFRGNIQIDPNQFALA